MSKHKNKTLQPIIGFGPQEHNPPRSQEATIAEIKRRMREVHESSSEVVEFPLAWIVAIATEAAREALEDGEDIA